MGESLMVGMAEIKVTRSPEDVLMALGLGSCIGICAYDAQMRVAGLAHVVLPSSAGHDLNPGKFADTAVPQLLEEMMKLGALPVRIKVAITGGAQLFAGLGSRPQLEIGPRNAAAVLAELEKRRIPVLAQDIGGSSGRTVHFALTGQVRVKTIGRGEQELVCLGAKAGLATPPTGATGDGRVPAYSAPLSAPGLNPLRSSSR